MPGTLLFPKYIRDALNLLSDGIPFLIVYNTKAVCFLNSNKASTAVREICVDLSDLDG